MAQVGDSERTLELTDVIDTHIHLSHHYGGGLKNLWHPNENEGFQRDWTEPDYRASVAKGAFGVKAAIFVECANDPPVEEAKWVLGMVDDPDSIVAGLTAHIPVPQGAAAVTDFLDQVRLPDGSLPRGLKGARVVLVGAPADACLEPSFFEGLEELGKHGLLWEFCCKPSMAPNLATCCAKFPNMIFIIDHLAHNGNEGGEMDSWGPAIDALGRLPNVYAKLGATEQWDVANPGEYMDRAISAFGFDHIMYESNWFVGEAMGDPYDRTASLLLASCKRAGATEADVRKVFADNAKRVYSLDL